VSTPPFLDLPDGVVATEVETPSGPLAVLAAGAADGPPALLVPGFTGSKEDFIGLLAPLAARGFRVVAIDQRGQFESPGTDDPATYDLDALAGDVLQVCDVLGDRVHLVGHSFGGLVARAAAIEQPDAVVSLTLMSSGPAAIPHPSASNLELIVQALPVMDLEAIWEAKRRIESATEVAPPPSHIEDFLHRRFVANHPTALLRMAQQLLTEQDRVDALADRGLRTLVLYGAQDDAWPPSVQDLMAKRLGADVVVVEAAGHSPAAEEPAATAAALATFWADEFS
jgi:pimeloyl-ACP methyl ester carboxylesterase